MPNARARLEDDLPADAAQTKCEIDVFEIAAERFRKTADRAKQFRAIEGARSACSKYASGLQRKRFDGLTVAALARETAQVIRIAGTIDSRSALSVKHQYERSNGDDARVAKSFERDVGPTRLDLGIVVQQFDDRRSRFGNASINGAAESTATSQPDWPHACEFL